MLYECQRCGHQEQLNRVVGRFKDEDFIEVFAELMDADAALRECAVTRSTDLRKIHALIKDREALEHALAAAQNDLVATRLEVRLAVEEQTAS